MKNIVQAVAVVFKQKQISLVMEIFKAVNTWSERTSKSYAKHFSQGYNQFCFQFTF